ncbi:ComEA family DNA-binding protein [Pseudomonas sp. FP2309]|uniref:ComEA family DNA-binding protein n=1 Tax=Pseudomonas sp. FP2309 TaxID=2954091 RepID=UPI002734D15C|nr:ComEA family DNA-binding protein [Pseudomonas sp. FP2309]WLH70103.1 ComEA family DNA-binding protein [Pseudomonas sp. FP2309]
MIQRFILPFAMFCALGASGLSVAAAEVQPSKSEGAVTSSDTSTKLNLNTADAPTLTTQLTGIGEAKAQAIVAYREANGPFTSVDELLEVKGIGKSLLHKNRDKLTVN